MSKKDCVESMCLKVVKLLLQVNTSELSEDTNDFLTHEEANERMKDRNRILEKVVELQEIIAMVME